MRDGILISPEVSASDIIDLATAFPGLTDRIGRYDKSFQEAGQKEGLINVNETMGNVVKLKTAAERKAYMNSLLRRYSGDPSMSEFLKNLVTLF